jgi:PAS domain S-box-containing protein
MHKNGTVRYFESTARPYFDEGGNLEGFCGIDREITRRFEAEHALIDLNQKLEQRVEERTQELAIANQSLRTSIEEFVRTQEILQETNRRYKALFEGSSDAVAIISLDDKIIQANQQTEILLGYDAEELMNMPLSQFMHPDEWADAEEKTAALFSGEIVPPYERIIVNKSGQEVPVEINLTLIRDDNGAPKYFQSIVRNISKRKLFEAALKDSEERFRLAFEKGPLGIAIADHDLRIIDANETFCQITSYSKDEIIGSTFETYTHPEDITREKPLFDQLFKGEIPGYNIQKRYITRSGETVWINLTAGILRDQEGAPQYALGIAEDITERKINEEELRKHREQLEQLVEERTTELQNSNEELKSFAYSVSHDLRAPLRAITGFADILNEDFSSTMDLSAQEHLQRIRAAATHMEELIHGLLELSRISHHELRLQVVNLSQMAEEVIRNYQQGDPGRQIEISINPQMTAEGDPILLRIVVENLLGNAWKFTGKQKQAQIEFDCREVNGRKVFSVRDNGAGFDMKLAEKLFNVFQRLHASDQFEGTGIGLATVQKIVHRHGGKVWTEAEEGKGATFFFTLS